MERYTRVSEILGGPGLQIVPGQDCAAIRQRHHCHRRPDGSGKSNISDAISWVLGEQSSKALRGAKMEDVIFGGTQKRVAVGYAEATLVLDNQAGQLRIETPEVALRGAITAPVMSEYFINRQSARLRDINELLMDTGLGKEGYSNIGQGKVDEILALKSTDRREVFEEAAGISNTATARRRRSAGSPTPRTICCASATKFRNSSFRSNRCANRPKRRRNIWPCGTS